MKNKNLLIFGILSLILVVGIVLISSNNVSSYETLNNFEGEMAIYKSSTCGCCGIYSGYFSSKGNKDVEIIETQDRIDLKNEYGVPSSLESCHTTIVGDYFVEGHVPLEAIEKLLLEKPDIAGIGMPGMPNGSPGMPGQKSGVWVIYGVNHDGSTFEFMRI